MMLLQQRMLFQRRISLPRPVFSSVVRPRPVFSRAFAGKRGQFLDFEEARAYVRKLGLRRAADWTAWSSSSERPAFIPSRPVFVYGSHFRGLEDFLGYEKRKPLVRDPEYAVQIAKYKESAKSGASSFGVRNRGREAFLKFMEPVRDRVEFLLLNSRGNMSLLFRFRDGPAGLLWSPIHVRARQQLRRENCLEIGKVTNFRRGGAAIHVVDKNAFYFIPADDLQARQSETSRTSKMVTFPEPSLSQYEISSPESMVSRLEEQYAKSRMTMEDANDEHLCSKQLPLLRQLTEKLYNRGGFPLSFGVDADWEAPHNASVCSRPVVHAAISFGLHRKCARSVVFLRKGDSGRMCGLPLHINDKFDFVVVMNRSRAAPMTLLGVFIFPKSALGTCISSDGHVGTRVMSIFSPGTKPVRRDAAAKQKFQEQFYIDLSNADVFDAQVRKAKAIFNGSFVYEEESAISDMQRDGVATAPPSLEEEVCVRI